MSAAKPKDSGGLWAVSSTAKDSAEMCRGVYQVRQHMEG